MNTSPNDVVILDEIVNDANGNATFFVFVYTKQPDEVLSGKVLEVSTCLTFRWRIIIL